MEVALEYILGINFRKKFFYKITLFPFNNIINSFKSDVITTKFSTIFFTNY